MLKRKITDKTYNNISNFGETTTKPKPTTTPTITPSKDPSKINIPEPSVKPNPKA